MNLDSPPYLISHGHKIVFATRSEVADCVCAALQVCSVQRRCNISTLKAAQSYSVSLSALFGKDPTRPNFCSIADAAIIRGSIGSPGSPYLILWSFYKKIDLLDSNNVILLLKELPGHRFYTNFLDVPPYLFWELTVVYDPPTQHLT